MGKSIDDLLSGDAEQPETVVEQAEPEVVEEAQPETAERPRGPDGKFISKETGVESTEPVEAAPVEQVPPTEQSNQLPREEYTALKAIRDENKELKRSIEAMQRQMMQPQRPQAEKPQPITDFWEDPQTFLDQRLSGLGEELLERFEQRQQTKRLEASEQAAKTKYADYDEKFAAFEQAVQLNPRLAYELAQASDPGEFAYARGKTALEIQRVGSLDDLKAQIRAEMEAEARAVIQPAPRLQLPSTTAADGSVGGRGGPAWGGPAPMSDLLG
jgi:hypothetical protein